MKVIEASLKSVARQLAFIYKLFNESRDSPVNTPKVIQIDNTIREELVTLRKEYDSLLDAWIYADTWACVLYEDRKMFLSFDLVIDHVW